MINFRYHLVSLAAVLFALAGGVALGAGPLEGGGGIVAGDDATNASVSEELVGFDTAFAQRTGGSLLGDSLEDQTVTIFELPGADGTQVDGVSAAIEQAGGSVVNRVTLLPKLIDSSGRQFAEGVAQQSTSGVDGVSTDGDSYVRIGSALGRAYLAKKPGESDTASATIASAFVQGKLVKQTGDLSQRASLAVVIAGAEEPDRQLGQAAIVEALSLGFDGSSRGALVAGPSSSSEEDGFIDAVRTGDAAAEVSTVDVLDSAGGQLAVALVLAQEAQDESGAYGTSRSSNGPLPAS